MIHNSAAMPESTRAISMSTAQTGADSRVRASPTAEPRRPTELSKCVLVLNRDDHPMKTQEMAMTRIDRAPMNSNAWVS